MSTQTENPPLLALIDQGAPDDILFSFDGAAVSRKNFARKVAQTASWLSQNGIGEGDVVAVWLVNRVEWLALLFAAARLGAIVAAVNTRYRAADVAHVVGLSGAKMLVLEPGFRSIDFPAILRDLDPAAVPALETIAIVGAGAVEAPWRCVPFDAFETDASALAPGGNGDAPLLLFTTSGTTKGPKLVAHSQTTLAGHARSIAAA